METARGMRAVIYCRVSTKEQVNNLSLPTQEKTCRDFCKREGIAVQRVFVEEGESAKTANRTQLKSMLEYCRRHSNELDFAVFYSVSRLSRNTLDYLAIKAGLAGLGIKGANRTELAAADLRRGEPTRRPGKSGLRRRP